MKKVLFICVGNAARSQMAEAFYNAFSKGGGAISAGVKPKDEIDPNAVRVMNEVGIDISGQKPKPLQMEMIEEADKIIIMGCAAEEVCPAVFLDKVEDWGLMDPAGKPIETVRTIRNEIKRRVEKLIEEGY